MSLPITEIEKEGRRLFSEIETNERLRQEYNMDLFDREWLDGEG